MCAKIVFENERIGFLRAINATLLCPHTLTNVHVCGHGSHEDSIRTNFFV